MRRTYSWVVSFLIISEVLRTFCKYPNQEPSIFHAYAVLVILDLFLLLGPYPDYRTKERIAAPGSFPCGRCSRVCSSAIGLRSHLRAHERTAARTTGDIRLNVYCGSWIRRHRRPADYYPKYVNHYPLQALGRA